MLAGADDGVDVLRLRDALRAAPGVRLALLFGSAARGQASPSSDLDLAVQAPGVDLLALAASLGEVTGRAIDIVSMHDLPIPLLAELVRDAVVLHEAEEHEAVRWRLGALLALETDLPWYRRMRKAFVTRLASASRTAEPGA